MTLFLEFLDTLRGLTIDPLLVFPNGFSGSPPLDFPPPFYPLRIIFSFSACVGLFHFRSRLFRPPPPPFFLPTVPHRGFFHPPFFSLPFYVARFFPLVPVFLCLTTLPQFFSRQCYPLPFFFCPRGPISLNFFVYHPDSVIPFLISPVSYCERSQCFCSRFVSLNMSPPRPADVSYNPYPPPLLIRLLFLGLICPPASSLSTCPPNPT